MANYYNYYWPHGISHTWSTSRRFTNVLEHLLKELTGHGSQSIKKVFKGIWNFPGIAYAVSTDENQDHISAEAEMNNCMSNMHSYLDILNNSVIFS